MHILHKAMKVNALLFGKRQAVIETIDQVGLATSDATPEIQTFDGPRFAGTQQRFERLNQRLVLTFTFHKFVVQLLQEQHRFFLGGIWTKAVASQILVIFL